MYKIDKNNEIKNGIYKTSIEGLFFIDINKHEDDRGFYAELSRIPELNEILTKPFEIKQINHSFSVQYVTRGMHAENWQKLVTVVSGSCFSALVDLRAESPTFKQVEIIRLGLDENCLYGCLYIPYGVANSVCIENKHCHYLYFVDELYKNRDPRGDKSISLFDPELNINWPITRDKMILSQRDLNCVYLKDLER